MAAAVALQCPSRADNRRLRAVLPRPLAARIHAASSRSPDAPSASSISAAPPPTRSDGLRRTSTRPLARLTRRGVPSRRPLATGWCGASTAATEGTPHTSSSGLSSTTSVPSRAARASAHSSTALHCQNKRFSRRVGSFDFNRDGTTFKLPADTAYTEGCTPQGIPSCRCGSCITQTQSANILAHDERLWSFVGLARKVHAVS